MGLKAKYFYVSSVLKTLQLKTNYKNDALLFNLMFYNIVRRVTKNDVGLVIRGKCGVRPGVDNM